MSLPKQTRRLVPTPDEGGGTTTLGAALRGVTLAVALAALSGAAAPDPHRALTGLIVFAAVLWVTEAFPAAVTALLVTAGTVLFGVATPKQAFAAFGSPVLFLFVGSFFIAKAMEVQGLGIRLARKVSQHARGPVSMMVGLSSVAFALSMWMSNVAATAIVLPIALATAQRANLPAYSERVVLSIAWGASMGGLATPVGTPPNLIGIEQLTLAGREVGFFEWMARALPIALLMQATLLGAFAWQLRRVLLPGNVVSTTAAHSADSIGHARWSPGEISVAVALGIAILGWLVPGVLQIVSPSWWFTQWLDVHVTEEIVAVLAGCLLFVLPGSGSYAHGDHAAPGQTFPAEGAALHRMRPALTWKEAVEIEWGIVLLFGGGLLLGDLAGKSGLSEVWGTWLVQHTGATTPVTMTMMLVAVAIVLSEFASNTAAATLLVPVAIGMAKSANLDPLLPALGATIGASFGFMLPVSTAPNAMAYGTGLLSVRRMVQLGVAFDFIGWLIVVLGLLLFVSTPG